MKQLAWDYFSLYIRIRDGWTCVLCGNSYDNGYIQQAGHIINRGKHQTLFNEDNVHCQCSICNQSHKYYPHTYYNWFITKYGQEPFLKLSNPVMLNQICKIDYNEVMENYRCEILAIIDNQPEHAKEKFERLNKLYNKTFHAETNLR